MFKFLKWETHAAHLNLLLTPRRQELYDQVGAYSQEKS